MLTLDLDLNLLSVQMNRYVTELGRDATTVVKDQARLLLTQLLKITPPKTLSQGRAAIKRDIKRTIAIVEDRKIRMPKLKDALRKGDYVAVTAILKNVKGPLRGLTAKLFTKGMHTSQRDSRGRVPDGRRPSFVALPSAAARKYVAEVQKRSGEAKGAWAPALQAVGAAVPAWIARNAKYGRVFDVNLGAGESDPRLTAINTARGIRALDQSDISRNIRFRENAMKFHITKLLALRAAENNLA